MRFEKVGMEKLEDLVKTRIQVLRAANKLDGSADMGQTEQESRTYYEKVWRMEAMWPILYTTGTGLSEPEESASIRSCPHTIIQRE